MTGLQRGAVHCWGFEATPWRSLGQSSKKKEFQKASDDILQKNAPILYENMLNRRGFWALIKGGKAMEISDIAAKLADLRARYEELRRYL